MNYYNDNNKKSVRWLEWLVENKMIPEGRVDSRSIKDVKPEDLDGYDQCHFFAGIAGWPLAFRWSGIEGVRGIFSGSCPCFPEGTLVLTRRGYVPIEYVVSGDEVLTHRARWRPVTHVGSDIGNLVVVKGQGHHGLVCTPGHPFLTGEDEWTKASDLKGESLENSVKSPRIPNPCSQQRTWC